jgi:hypothetical protein
MTARADGSRIEPLESSALGLVGYSELDDRPAFKLAIQEVEGRWYLYCGHLWHRGWSVVDVTDPAEPRVVRFVPGPPDTWTIQVNVADGLMVTALQRIPPQWGGRPGAAFEEAALVWDVRAPTEPRLLSRISLGGSGSHRNFWAGGRWLHMAANPAGFRGYVYVAVDLADPEHPVEAGRWWLPGQGPDEERATEAEGLSLHGPPYVVDDRAFLSYGGAGLVILDVADPAQPTLISRFPVAPPFHGGLWGSGVHSALPLPRRRLAVLNGEAHEERCDEPLDFAGIVDVADEHTPVLRSVLPLPVPSPGLPYASYCDKGGRFGPHNSHLPQGHPDHEARDDLVYLTWFNAGLRVYDVADARVPREIAHFVPPDPVRRYGPLPATALVAQSEDVLVDRRGVIYLTDKNQGLFVLRLADPVGTVRGAP